MSEKLGFKETLEALDGVLEVALRIAAVLKDGYQASDVVALFDIAAKDNVLKNKLAEAAKDISKVPEECKDLDIAEIAQLIAALLPYIPRFIDIFARKAV